jgi:hypothetical protein
MNRLTLNLMVLSLLMFSRTVPADYPIEVIELKARPLEEVLPVIRPLLGPGATATGMGNNLILKAAPAQVRQIRQLLHEIDRPPRRLLILVSKQGDRAQSSSGYSAGADIRTGDTQISINSPGYPVDETRARLFIHDDDGQRSRNIGQKVQAVEGRPAFIAGGATIPVYDVERFYRHGRVYERRLPRMRDASSGFYVVPRVSGDSVTLEIQQHDDRIGRYPGVINTQSTDTVVRGRLGEWITLGGIDTSSRAREGGLGRSYTAQDTALQQITVMVQCLDCTANIPPPRSQGIE